ncbi:MAG: pyroglutamyl-peptidase I [Thermoprotei archaeon]|nr:MAG: pyroglutamyl-peptidase I [Thermoprotei archaeon]
MDILVTGFKPWGKYKKNPSGELAERLDGRVVKNHIIRGYELEVSYKKVEKDIPSLIAKHEPVITLHLGLAAGTSYIRVERVAINIIDAGSDVEGREIKDEPIVPGGPIAYFSTLPTRSIVERLRKEGIPARLSYTAGTFLCNYTMYTSLHTIKTMGLTTLSGFIHLPLTPEMVLDGSAPSMPLEMMEKAVLVAIDVSLEHARKMKNQ